MKIEVLVSPKKEDHDIVLNALLAFNETFVGSNRRLDLTFHLRDDNGNFLGGANGYVHFNYFFVAHLWVSETLRGRGAGSKVLTAIEEEARSRDCEYIWLDTFSFQAAGFYEKNGYKKFGELDNYPPGQKRFFYVKSLR